MNQTDMFPQLDRTLTTEERLEKIREVKAAVEAMTFVADTGRDHGPILAGMPDLCRTLGNGYLRHDDDWLRGRCKRCGSPMPRIFVRAKG